VGNDAFIDPNNGRVADNPMGLEEREMAFGAQALQGGINLADIGAKQDLAMATLENNEWYRQNKLALEKMGVDLRMFKNQVEIMQFMTNPENVFRMQQAGIDPSGFFQSAPGQGAGAPNMPGASVMAPPQQSALPMATGQMPQPEAPPAQMPQGVPGASIMDPSQQSALPMATGQAPMPQVEEALAPAPAPAANPSPQVFQSIPGSELYGFDPVDGAQVVKREGNYFKMNPELGGFVQIDSPTFKSPGREKAEADAGMAQGQLQDRRTWEEMRANDPLHPFATYEDYTKNVGNMRAEAQKHLSERRADLEARRETNQKLEAFQQRNAQYSTGNPLQRLAPDNKLVNYNGNDLIALSADLKASSVPKGQGAVSDAERRLFGDAVPGLQYDREVNDALIGLQKMRTRYREEVFRAEQEFISQRGHMNGMDQWVADQVEQKFKQDPEYQKLRSLTPGGTPPDQSAQPPQNSGWEIISIE
jgi:hypothetical protein